MFCCKEMMNYNLNFPPCKKCHRVTSYNLSEQTVSCSSCLCLASNKIGSVNKRPDQLSKTWGDFVWDEKLINQYNWVFLTQNKEIIRFFQLPNKWDRLIAPYILTFEVIIHSYFQFIRKYFSEPNSPWFWWQGCMSGHCHMARIPGIIHTWPDDGGQKPAKLGCSLKSLGRGLILNETFLYYWF